ncbi:MAG TPA: protein kinase [Pyrinomonadaceae bacterium]|nr:protein kinase [Pyrinomonadaceae bacterium]
MKYCTSCKAKYDDSVSFCSIDGEVLEADPASIVDTVLDGQYQMEALLGKGGMGAVYRARHILLGDRVAIKVLPPEVRTNAEWLRRFRREGQAARRFRHPNAVTVYDLRTASDGTIYMVMEYVEGHTLDHEIKTRGKFTAKEAFEVLSPIMSVLDTAHAMGVVHRDLKPENIMVGKPAENGEPVVKLLDLGIAKMREIAGGDNGGNTALTMAGQVLGTPYYMSPEQWGEIPRDENTEIDGRADIYSLGLVFYEMILGRRCFSGNTLHELRREHVSTRPRPLHELVADVPRGFSDAIERATAKDRGDRQATTRVLADELRAGLATPSRSTNPLTDQPTDLTETVALSDRVPTNADVNAPTILTADATPTSAVGRVVPKDDGTVFEPAKPQPTPPPQPGRDASATVVESAAMASSVTVPRVPKPAPQPPIVAPVVAPASKSKAGLLIGVAVVFVILLVAGVGGFLLWNKLKSNGGATTNTNTNTTTEVATTPKEVGRYWLLLGSAEAAAPKTQVAGLVPVASGQPFSFHFTFDEDGYLYIVGPGKNNQLTAFLTAKPQPDTGLTTNKVSKGKEFSFPNGNTLSLDENPGTDNFTIIFSKSPLSSPSSLDKQVTFEPLSASEQADFKTFRSKYQEKPPVFELDDSNPKAQFVKVKTTSDRGNNPVVFDIRIQHN